MKNSLNYRPIQLIALLLVTLSPGPFHAITIEEQINAQAPYYSNCLKLKHPNITHQEAYLEVWDGLFGKYDSLPEEKIGEMTEQLIKEKDFYRNHPFFVGFSSSAYQFEGGIGDECSWHDFALRKDLTLPGQGCGFWENYEAMIKEMKEIGNINAFRMSIEWSRVEPIQGQFNHQALDHYRKIIETLKKNNIEPLIVLNHYTVPTWFEKIGDFEDTENITHFVKFAGETYLALGDLVTYWSTCNAPEGIAFKGRYTLTGAPGKEKSLPKTMLVVKNILEAHVQIYELIKGNPLKQTTGLWQQAHIKGIEAPEPKIGIQKNIIQLDVADDRSIHRIAASLTNIINTIGASLTDDPFYSFFTTGRFFINSVAPWIHISHKNKMAPYSFDWIGVNYYSNKKRFLFSDVPDTDIRKTTQNENYRFYPEGLYNAVLTMNEKLLKPLAQKTNKTVPIWITENGIAAIDDAQRAEFNKKIMIVILELIKEGLPIIGYTQWASHDNWEWGAPKGTKRYGSFHVNFDDVYGPHELKEGAKGLTEYFKAVTAATT